MFKKLIYAIAIMAVVGFSVWTCGDHERRISYLETTVAEYATVAPDPACSIQTTTFGGEAVERGTLEDGQYFPYADAQAVPSESDQTDIITTRITHYGPPRFTSGDTTARNITIADCLALVDQYGVDGFCAVSQGLPWYDNVRDAVPVCIEVEGHGRYLVLDRKGAGDMEGVDIYEPYQESFPGGYRYSHERYVLSY